MKALVVSVQGHSDQGKFSFSTDLFQNIVDKTQLIICLFYIHNQHELTETDTLFKPKWVI